MCKRRDVLFLFCFCITVPKMSSRCRLRSVCSFDAARKPAKLTLWGSGRPRKRKGKFAADTKRRYDHHWTVGSALVHRRKMQIATDCSGGAVMIDHRRKHSSREAGQRSETLPSPCYTIIVRQRSHASYVFVATLAGAISSSPVRSSFEQLIYMFWSQLGPSDSVTSKIGAFTGKTVDLGRVTRGRRGEGRER